jgi:hypothetical protein
VNELPTIDIYEDRWTAWSVTKGINGRPIPVMPVPEFVLFSAFVLAYAPYVQAWEEAGRQMIDVAGVRFELIGYAEQFGMFGARRSV